ncbi:type II toxin-antitoxin system RelE/ParE family toxin [Enterobacteriaceae bacterium 89]|nr:type II toxin-antitoxin system RelE/ParE family toxin [Enterobacteriaceae bacterium 89]
MKIIKHYLSKDGRDLYGDYFRSLKDAIAKAKIASRVNRIASDNFGDCRPCREGVWELRIDQGPGYRVYYSYVNGEVVLLLLAGDKRTQDADISQAVICLRDYLSR